MCSFYYFFFCPTDRHRPTFTRGRAIGNETFYGDGLTGPEKKNSLIKRKSVNWVCVLHTLSQTPKGRLTDFNMKM